MRKRDDRNARRRAEKAAQVAIVSGRERRVGKAAHV